jgi:hypothetical protein
MSDNNNTDPTSVHDPLKDLETRIVTDQSVVFESKVLEALADLRSNNPATYESLRAKLQAAGFRRMTALEKAMDGVGGAPDKPPSQADILTEIVNSAELFHTPDTTSYADITVNNHRETWKVRSKGYRLWLTHGFYKSTKGGAPSSEAMNSALNVSEAKARFDAPERAIHMRVGGANGSIFLDLGDESWRAVEITANGWGIVNSPPVRFRRPSGMLPLPIPVRGGSIGELRRGAEHSRSLKVVAELPVAAAGEAVPRGRSAHK